MSTIEEIASAFEQFKTHNDSRLKEIEKTGTPAAETTAAVNKANADITSLQARLAEESSKTDEKLADFEDRLNRANRGGRGSKVDDETIERYAVWQSSVRGKLVDPADVDLEFIGNYRKAFNDYVRRGSAASAESQRMLNELSVGSDPDGGYWVSPDLTGRVATMLMESSPIRQYANIQVISTDSLDGDVDLDEAASGGWVGETTARTETDTPQIGTWKIPVHEQYAEPRATQKVLDDSAINVEQWLGQKVAGKFERTENTAFVSSTGVASPRGFLTYTAGTPSASDWQKVQQVSSGVADALAADGLINLIYSMKSGYRSGAVFGMTRLTESKIRLLKDGEGRYLWQPNFSERGQASLMGFPVAEFADMPEVTNDALAIVFANFNIAYQIVDRMGIRVLRDPYTTKGRVKFYTTKRTGGDLVNFEAIKIQKVAV